GLRDARRRREHRASAMVAPTLGTDGTAAARPAPIADGRARAAGLIGGEAVSVGSALCPGNIVRRGQGRARKLEVQGHRISRKSAATRAGERPATLEHCKNIVGAWRYITPYVEALTLSSSKCS